MVLAEKFTQVFSGYTDAYALWYPHPLEEQKRSGKIEGNCPVIKKPWNLDHWLNHINGIQPISIIPLLETNFCNYAAIDIDKYEIPAEMVANTIKKFNLPCVACMSKSGGWHLYFFFDKPYPAVQVREKLSMIAANIGQAEAEIYPRQDSAKWHEGEVGNWLSLPYYDSAGGYTTRYAIDEEGKAIRELDTFLETCIAKRVTLDALNRVEFSLGQEFADGPCCLQYLNSKGIGEGSRNTLLYNVGIYYKLKFPESWPAELMKFNSSLQKPIDATELSALTQSLGKKSYNYQCRTQPLKGCCDSRTCRTRIYGVGDNGFAHQLAGLTKVMTEPATWFIDIGDGKRLTCHTEDLLNQDKFRRACVEYANRLPPKVEANLWDAKMRELLDIVTIVEVPRESTNSGILEDTLFDFLENRQAEEKHEMRQGRPFYENGFHFARMKDMKAHIDRKRAGLYGARDITNAIRRLEGKSESVYTKFGTVQAWCIPAKKEFVEQMKLKPKEDLQSTY